MSSTKIEVYFSCLCDYFCNLAASKEKHEIQ